MTKQPTKIDMKMVPNLETGAVQFEQDSPGFYFTGDDALKFIVALNSICYANNPSNISMEVVKKYHEIMDIAMIRPEKD